MPVALAEPVQHARIICRHQLAVGIEVRNLRHMLHLEIVGDMPLRLLEVAKAPAERDLRVVVQVLSRKHQHGIRLERIFDVLERRIVKTGQVDAGDFGAEDGRQFANGDCQVVHVSAL